MKNGIIIEQLVLIILSCITNLKAAKRIIALTDNSNYTNYKNKQTHNNETNANKQKCYWKNLDWGWYLTSAVARVMSLSNISISDMAINSDVIKITTCIRSLYQRNGSPRGWINISTRDSGSLFKTSMGTSLWHLLDWWRCESGVWPTRLYR